MTNTYTITYLDSNAGTVQHKGIRLIDAHDRAKEITIEQGVETELFDEVNRQTIGRYVPGDYRPEFRCWSYEWKSERASS